jgi:hypothetical protein
VTELVPDGRLGTPGRVVALGASNLTRGFHTIVAASRQKWGADIEVLGALGHGRSYGAPSRFLGRTLPGILQSGLWRELDRLPSVATRALITDVGNDILYGVSASQILAWVEECVDRLQRRTADIVLTGLPLFNIRRLSRTKFLVFRSLFFPACRLSLAQMVGVAEQVAEGLEALVMRRGVRLFPLRPEWYGVDPIHIRRALWRTAWQQILCAGTDDVRDPRASTWEAVRVYFLPPERRWLFGVEGFTPQTGRGLPNGGRVWLY